MKRGMIVFLRIVMVLSLVLVSGPGSAQAAGSIKVGIVLPLTGSLAKFGELEKHSFQMALEEINTTGGINGKQLDLLIEDTTGRPEVGRSVVEKLIAKDKVVMIGGGYSSSVTYAIADICQLNKIPFLVNTGAADKITTSGWDYIFRLNPPFSKYARGIESLFSDIIRPRTVVILREDSPFGSKRAQFFSRICKKLQMKVVLNESYGYGEIDFTPALIRTRKKNPDIIYMVSHAVDASLLMKQAKELELTPKMFVGGAVGFTLPEFQQDAGVASDKVISATLWHQVLPFPGAMDFYNKFNARYNKSVDYHGAEAYAACYVIADVLKRAKSYKNTDIREALLNTDMTTVFGPVKFTTWGKMKNQNKPATYVVQWINGKLELVWPKQYATKSLAYPVNWLKVWGY